MKKKRWAVLITVLMLCILMACGGSTTASKKQSQTTVISQNTANVAKKKDINGLGWGAEVSLGSYEQDNNTGNGKEPIEWIVLEVQNDKMLLLSKYVLDASYFDEKQEVAFWDTCTLRTWLNDSFLNDAFNDKQQQSIVLSETTTSDGYIPNTQNNSTVSQPRFIVILHKFYTLQSTKYSGKPRNQATRYRGATGK